jgi:integrase
LHAAAGRWRPFLFSGLRSSELRGLRWIDLDLTLPTGRVHVRQRADAWGRTGAPKSKAGYRSIPIGEHVVRTLQAWKELCPKFDTKEEGAVLYYVFPTGKGYIESHQNIVKRGLFATQIVAGLSEPMLDAQGNPRFDHWGKPLLRGKYNLHAFRHFYCSWLIERRMAHKEIQSQMGHSSLVMTLDRYGHLFPRTDDAAEMAAAEAALLGPVISRQR